MKNTEIAEQRRAAVGAGPLAERVPETKPGELGVVASATLRDWFGPDVARIEITGAGGERSAVLYDRAGGVVSEVPASAGHRFAQATRFADAGSWKLAEAVDAVATWAEDADGRRVEGDGVPGFSRMATVVLAQLGKTGWVWEIAASPYELRWVAEAIGMPEAVRVGVDPGEFAAWLCERRPLVAGRLIDAVLLT